MELSEFNKIFENEDTEWEGDNAIQGLLIIQKYIPNKGIEAAEHDIIYSVSADDLVEAGITTEDAESLRKLNWMIYDGFYMACFV